MKAAFFRRFLLRSLLVFMLTCVTLGTVLFLERPHQAHAATATFSESNQTTLYTHDQLNSKGIGGYTDGEMGVWQNGSNYSFLGSDAFNSNHTTITTGSLDDPIQTVSAHLPIQNVPGGFNYVSGGPVYKDSGTGHLLTFVHLERWPNGDGGKFWGSLGLAISKDGGASWTWCGEIIQHNDPYSTSPQGSEEVSSGSFVIVNGYFYVYATDSNTNHTPGISVVRAPVSDVVNAAENDQVTAWSKYYNGGWNSPGLGGSFTNILGFSYGGEEDISYNTYLQQYVLAFNYGDSQGHYYITLRSSDNPLDFSTAPDNYIAYRAGGYSQYPTIVGTGTNPQYNSGQTFYVYYISWGSDGVFGSQMTLSRSTITATPVTRPTVFDASFETPSVGPTGSYNSFQYTPGGSSWNFSGGGGIAANGSGFTGNNPNAPDGVQVGFLQNANSSFSQTIGNFAANTSYSFTFAAAQRGNPGQGGQSVQVYLDTTSLGQFTPASSSYADLTTNSIIPGAGNHTLKFVGLSNCDCTALLDNVRINQGTSGASYQASTGFSSTQGQNQWSYQYSTNGDQSFQNLTWDGTNNAWDGPGGYYGFCDVAQNWQIPNTSCDAARIWQAPQAGTVTLSSNGPLSVQAACGGNNTGTRIRILKNGSQIWPSSGWQSLTRTSSYTFPAGVTTSVNSGDQLQFLIATTGTDNYCTVTVWDQIVSYT